MDYQGNKNISRSFLLRTIQQYAKTKQLNLPFFCVNSGVARLAGALDIDTLGGQRSGAADVRGAGRSAGTRLRRRLVPGRLRTAGR